LPFEAAILMLSQRTPGKLQAKETGERSRLVLLPGRKPRRQALTQHVAIAHCDLAAVLCHENAVESIRAACAADTLAKRPAPDSALILASSITCPLNHVEVICWGEALLPYGQVACQYSVLRESLGASASSASARPLTIN
jgi:hypothetical protein